MAELHPKDLTKEAPRSPHERLGGFSILARAIDKCRAFIAGAQGEYYFDCPVDRMLFAFKGINAEEFKIFVAEGHSDEEIVEWVKSHGNQKSDDEIAIWSDGVDGTTYNNDPEKMEWFSGECKRLGIDPSSTTLFQYLDIDDKACFDESGSCPI